MPKGLSKEKLLAMEIGDSHVYDDGGPDSGPGHLKEIHRTFGGWIYLFRERHSGHHRESTALTSQFVPEEVNVNTMRPPYTGG